VTFAEAEIAQALAGDREAVALVWVGSNDLWGIYGWDCDENSPPSCAAAWVDAYRTNLDAILSRLSGAGAQLIVALLDDHSKRPAAADEYFGITAAERPLLAEAVQAFNVVVSELAARYGAWTVDFYNTTLFEDAATLSEDGNHPNTAGYDRIAELWFEAAQHLLSSGDGPTTFNLSLSIQGSGRVSSSDGAINCPGTCSAAYPANSEVTLQIHSGDIAHFVSWSGACDGTLGTSCTLNMSTGLAVLASFTAATPQPDNYSTQVYTLYLGYFGRPPAPAGVDYYGAAMTRSGGNWRIIADDFWNSSESQSLYPPGLSTREKINQVFENLFSRPANTAGLDYWEGLINNGTISLPEIAYTLAYNASAEDTAIVEAKRQSARLWVNSLDTAEEQAAFGTAAGQQTARDFLAGIDSATPASQSAIDQAIAALPDDSGDQNPPR
jgi:lysophospholipase L1-like esterase